MRSRRRASFAALPVLVACLLPSAAAPQTWVGGETVGPSGVLTAHTSTSLALKPSDTPCIAYYEGDDGDLKFAELVGDTWSITTVDTTGQTGQYCSLALDAAGNPHIAYYYKLHPNGTSEDRLRYASRSGGIWTLEDVDPADVSGFCELAFDSAFDPHITYFNGSSLSLKHATRTGGGSWSIETVDNAGNVGQHAALRIDASDNIHVAYQDTGNQGIKYGVKSGGSWTLEPVAGLNVFPPILMTAVDISLAVESNGDVHIVYRNESSAKSMYSENTTGSWQTDIARALGQDLRGSFHSLQMGPGDTPTMAFYDEFWQDLRLAPFDGTWWVPQPLRPDGAAASLVLNANGHAHVSYHVLGEGYVGYVFQSDVLSDAGPTARSPRASLLVSPNPMVASTTLILRSPSRVTLGLDILDARGRLVRSLGEQSHAPGLNYLKWDGLDAAGNAVGAGVYFAVSRPGNVFATRKIVVIR